MFDTGDLMSVLDLLSFSRDDFIVIYHDRDYLVIHDTVMDCKFRLEALHE